MRADTDSMSSTCTGSPQAFKYLNTPKYISADRKPQFPREAFNIKAVVLMVLWMLNPNEAGQKLTPV